MLLLIRYRYFTLLRNPIDRYLSEWLHVRRGATWSGSTLRCKGQSPSYAFYHPCYLNNSLRDNDQAVDWYGVTLHDFMSCPFNLASNRQSRMLANLSRLNCYHDLTEWTRPINFSQSFQSVQSNLLASAKANLVTHLFCFGLTEFLIYTQFIFEKCLNIRFSRPFVDFNSTSVFDDQHQTHANLIWSELTNQNLTNKIKFLNRLDLELYKFGRLIFLFRLVNYLLYRSEIGLNLIRPLRTLRCYNWSKSHQGLEYLILNKNSSYSKRLNRRLIQLFFKHGSVPASSHQLMKERQHYLKKLNDDLELDF